MDSVVDLCYGLNNLEITALCFDRILTLKKADSKCLLSLLESGVFDHRAKCFILDHIPEDMADTYWSLYQKVFDEKVLKTDDLNCAEGWDKDGDDSDGDDSDGGDDENEEEEEYDKENQY